MLQVAFEKAMTEHRTPDYRQSLSEVIDNAHKWIAFLNQCQVESELKKAEELAYINPEIAEQEKLKGNDWSVNVNYLFARIWLAYRNINFIRTVF